ncbi:MAG TPA: hypothetical protein VF037_08895 [Gemmatimonadales bacterium]
MEARSSAGAMGQGALVKATITGTLLQAAMVILGHFMPAIAASFPVVGTGLGAVTGFLFSKWGGRHTRMASGSGGALAGGVAGMLGSILSAALGDVGMDTVGIATISTVVAGFVGAAAGHRNRP